MWSLVLYLPILLAACCLSAQTICTPTHAPTMDTQKGPSFVVLVDASVRLSVHTMPTMTTMTALCMSFLAARMLIQFSRSLWHTHPQDCLHKRLKRLFLQYCQPRGLDKGGTAGHQKGGSVNKADQTVVLTKR